MLFRSQDPQWAVKVRFKSTAMTLLGEATGSVRGNRRAEPARGSTGASAETPPAQPSASDPIKDGINILRGIFGR